MDLQGLQHCLAGLDTDGHTSLAHVFTLQTVIRRDKHTKYIGVTKSCTHAHRHVNMINTVLIDSGMLKCHC